MIKTETERENINRELAFSVFGNCDDGSVHPDDAVWNIEDFAVESVRHLYDDVSGWLVSERENWLEEYGEHSHYDEFLEAKNFQEYLDEHCDWNPVISINLEGAVQIWDGWHRFACALVRGEQSMRVCVGRQLNYTPKPVTAGLS